MDSATCLDCQCVGGTVTGSCHAGDLLQPSPRLLPFSIALLLCRCCSCPCQGLGLSSGARRESQLEAQTWPPCSAQRAVNSLLVAEPS